MKSKTWEPDDKRNFRIKQEITVKNLNYDKDSNSLRMCTFENLKFKLVYWNEYSSDVVFYFPKVGGLARDRSSFSPLHGWSSKNTGTDWEYFLVVSLVKFLSSCFKLCILSLQCRHYRCFCYSTRYHLKVCYWGQLWLQWNTKACIGWLPLSTFPALEKIGIPSVAIMSAHSLL